MPYNQWLKATAYSHSAIYKF